LVFALACAACTGSDGDAAGGPSTTADQANFDEEAAHECTEAENSGRYDGELVAAFDSTVGDVGAALTANVDPGIVMNPDDPWTVCWFDDGHAGLAVLFNSDGQYAGKIPAERVPERP